jgi:hypothetical protein
MFLVGPVVTEGKFTFQFHVLAAAQGTALGADQYVLVVKFAVVFDSHG